MQGAGRVRDVVIVGSGPASYTAAIYAARAGLDTLVVEGHLPGGALMAAGQMDNYPGFSVPVCGPSLARAMRAQAHCFGAQFHTGEVDGLDLEGEVKSIAINDDLRHASALILAMGAVDRPLSVPGERELRGNGVSTSAKRDGDQFAGREVAVVGAATPQPRRPCFWQRWPAACPSSTTGPDRAHRLACWPGCALSPMSLSWTPPKCSP